MYEKYFGLTSAPFSIAPDPQYLYMSDRHREALAHLIYGVKNNGFILLTGEVGTGKTTVCRCLLEQLPDDVDTAFIVNPKVTENELLSSICNELRISYRQQATSKELIDGLNNHLLETLEEDRRTLVIIDEAQNLSVGVLEQLRLLTNLETNQRKLLQIILLGQPELLDTLARKSLRQLSQRVTARFHLEALNKNESRQYIAHRLSIAGARGNFFKRSAMDSIYRISKGIPRVINLICDHCLLGAYAENQAVVSPRIVKKASKEILLDNSRFSRITMTIISGLAGLAGLAIAVYLFMYVPLSGYSDEIEDNNQNLIETPVTNVSEYPELNTPISLVTGHSDKGLAFDDLFALWGIYINDRNLPPCKAINPIGLACLELTSNLQEITNLNRPVIVHLSKTLGWITISSLNKDNATLIAREREYSVSKKELNQSFGGSFTVVWRMPPGYQRPISLGDRGADVDWLVYQLSILEDDPNDKITGHVFDKTTSEKVMLFQKSANLTANGIVDPLSWIYLNSIEAINIPVLYQAESDNPSIGED